MTQVPIAVAVSCLSLSPHNVRKSVDAVADAQLKASIAARGVLQNLVGVPQRKPKGHFAIIAGGRRLRMVQELVAEGALPPDQKLMVLPLADAASDLETSLDENFQKLRMNPAEECAAFGEILAGGTDVEAVARRFGVTVRFVEGRLRLARLAAPVLEALRDGTITLDVAQAFATTSDVERQTRVFEREQASSYDRFNPYTIRRLMIDGGTRGSDPRARLVGRDAYLAAGGLIDADLFSDEGSETWLDSELLERLAGEQMAAAAQALKEAEGWGEVRWTFGTTPPWSERYELAILEGTPPEASETLLAERSRLEAEIAALEGGAEGEGLSDADWERVEALEAQLRTLELPVVDANDRARGITYVGLAADGSIRPLGDAFVLKAEATDCGGASSESGEPTVEAESVDDTPRLSQRLVEELAAQRTGVVALHVARDIDSAIDLAAFLLAERATTLSYELPSTLRADPPSIAKSPDISPAAAQFEVLTDELDRSWIDGPTVEARLTSFCALEPAARRAWLAWAVARSLTPVRSGGSGEGLLGAIAQALEIDIARDWRPSAANYFDRVPKAVTLAALTAIGGDTLARQHAGLKKAQLAAAAEELFARGDRDDERPGANWLPDGLGFPIAVPANQQN